MFAERSRQVAAGREYFGDQEMRDLLRVYLTIAETGERER
jgi:hypothetical protein